MLCCRAVAEGLVEETAGAIACASLGANGQDHTAVVLQERDKSEEDFRGDADARTGEQSVNASKDCVLVIMTEAWTASPEACLCAEWVKEPVRTSEIPLRGFQK